MTAVAQQAGQYARDDFLTGMSVGFSPVRSSWTYAAEWDPELGPDDMDSVTSHEARLLEVSLVSTRPTPTRTCTTCRRRRSTGPAGQRCATPPLAAPGTAASGRLARPSTTSVKRAISTATWQRLRLMVLDRDHWSCQIRGPGCSQHATCVDHIEARSIGGAMWDPKNIRASCRTCNLRAASLLQRRQGAGFYSSSLPPASRGSENSGQNDPGSPRFFPGARTP